MASVTILKNRENKNFKKNLANWLKENKKLQGLCGKEQVEVLKIINKFASEIEIVKAVEESSDFVTNVGLHATASNLIEEYIKENTDYVIFDNLEIKNDDHVLIVLPD
jgi:hypothetical protein